MRRISFVPQLRFAFAGFLILALAACGGGSDNDGGRVRSARTGIFIDSPVSGLDYSTPSRSGVTGNAGVLGSFSYLAGENISFSLDCIPLGTAPGQLVISPRTLKSGQAATNLARLLLSLDADGNNTNGIEVGGVSCPAGGLGTINFDLDPDDFQGQSAAFEDFIEDNASNNIDPTAYDNTGDDLVGPGYADDHLTCALQGGVYINGVCSNAPSISVNNVSKLEGHSGTSLLTFTVTLSKTSLQQVQVNYATAPQNPVSATEGVDYQAASGTLSFPANTTSQTFSVTINGDTTPETDETFLVNLSNPDNATIADGQGTGTITNDDGAAGAPQLSITAATSVNEGASGVTPANFTVTLANPPASGDVTVQVQTADDTSVPAGQRASANVDYAGIAPAQTLTLNAANTTRTVTVNVNGDNDVEANERFAVVLSGATGAFITSDTGIGTIVNDDAAPAVPELGINDVTLSEGSTGTTNFSFTVTLSPNAAPVSVNYATANGSSSPATGGAACNAATDYLSATGSVNFPASAVSQTQNVTVQVCGDFLVEPAETFFVNLAAPSGVTVIDSQGLGTINNDDAPLFRVGAASRSISPTQAQVAGQDEDYLGGTREQFFHLGGFGFGPFKLVPSVGGASPELVLGTDPAAFSEAPVGEPCFANSLAPPTLARGYEPDACDGSNGDHTWVRAFVIEAPENPDDRVVFVSMDAVGAGNLIQDGMKAAIRQASCDAGACIESANILIGQTHTHAGADLQGLWGGVPREWIQQKLYQGAAAAVAEALAERKAANVVMARGHTGDFNSYRRPKLRGDEEVDLTMTLLQARAADGGGVIGTIMQYAAHPTSIGSGDFNTGNGVVRVPHPDYPLGAEEDLEASFGGTALYFNGPIADASASGGPGGATPYDSVKNRGDAMATRARTFLTANEVTIDPVMSVRHADVILPITNPLFLAVAGTGSFSGYYQFTQIPKNDIPGLDQVPPDAFGQIEAAQNQLPQLAPIARTLVSRISLGTPDAGNTDKNRLEIVTIPGESTNTFGQYIRRLAVEDAASVAAPERHTMLLGLTQNSFGYIIPEEEFNYFDQTGGTGFLLPFTGYEEFVSLGPLTAPLLRTQGYNVLFDAAPEQNIPPSLLACVDDPMSTSCLLAVIQARLALLLETLGDLPALLDDALDALADGCHEFAGPAEPACAITDALAGVLDGVGGVPGVPGPGDAALVPEAVKAVVQGCDMLDPAHCLFPFPNDHFTVAAPAGSPQSVAQGGTGRRVNFNILGMPRNIANKPIDPAEWNRNDGFSPGAVILTYVPNLGTVKDVAGNNTGPVTGAVPLTTLDEYDDADAPVIVIDAATGERHPVWAEINLNAGKLLPTGDTPTLTPARPSLMIRPATNFIEGHRYIVLLRNLVDQDGQPIPAGAAFATCRDGIASALPPLQQRCAELAADVFPVIEDAEEIEIEDNEELFLAWDFTVSSAKNNTSRLVQMRDDAFRNVLGDEEDEDGNIIRFGRAPSFTVTEVKETGIDARLARVVRGTFTIPSYVTPADPSPLDGQTEVRNQLKMLAAQAPAELEVVLDQCGDVDPTGLVCDFLDPDSGVDLAASVSLPPNRLFYNALDGLNPADPVGSLYGDGLPDRSPLGSMTATFTCNIPKSAVDNPGTARPSLYGHGLLGSQNEGGVGGGGGPVTQMGGEHNMMFCAADWFGFATGDVPNILTVLLDLSNFPVVPDGTQQGMLNFMFLARLMAHPQGFAADPAFQAEGQPVFDRREVFYDGNSQGGILGGPVIAVSKDVNRGVLGVPAQNYSTLLQRSVDFDTYAIPLYLAYPDDLDRDLGFALIQMLWDRSENNGYTQHMTQDTLGGPDNQILLHPAFADHQVSHWAAQTMARTLEVEVADIYPRKSSLGECGGNVQFCFADGFAGKQAFFDERDPDISVFWDLPLVGRDNDAEYDEPGCPLVGTCRTAKSAFVEFDKGETATPPIGNVPPRADGFDPHSFPRATRYGNCQKSHFLHTQGRVIDVRDVRNVTDAASCPELPAAVGDAIPGGAAGGSNDICDPLTNDLCLSDVPVLGGLLAGLLITVDDTLDTVTDVCHSSAGPLEPACAATDLLADLIINDGVVGPGGPVGGVVNASCGPGGFLPAESRSYQVTIPSESGKTISFQVLEPAIFDCDSVADGAHPLIVQGHGFGGSRSTSGFTDYRNAGYAVISVDQRGFGGSSGTVRVMDPDFEGKDLVRILDWAETNLDYLAYRDDNLLVGTIGGSYGGGYQFLLHNVDPKDRIDAMAPDITWHDLRWSLNPGDVLKTGWDLLLSVGGVAGSYPPGLQNQELPTDRGMDPFIMETLARGAATGEFPREALEWFRYHSPTYWCDLNGEPTMPYEVPTWAPVDPNTLLGTLLGESSGSNTRSGQPPVDVLLSQGFKDTLFNFNDSWWNYQCARVRGGDVRLITHQSGHLLPAVPHPLNFQTAGGSGNCGAVNRGVATIEWFNEKLRGQPASGQLNGTDGALCLSLAENDAIYVPEENVLAPRAEQFEDVLQDPGTVSYYQIGGVGASSVPQGVLAQVLYDAQQLTPAAVPLLTVSAANGAILAGIPQASITVTTPTGVNDAACAGGANVPTTRTGCDSIVFVGLGVKKPGGAWQLVDDQVLPVRGLGAHDDISLVGVGERLVQGDELALLIYGYHPQYLASFSRDPSIAVVNVEADLRLPLYAATSPAANSAPDFTGNPASSVSAIATGTGCSDPSQVGVNPACIAEGTATNVVRQLCDYQWLPGVCEAFAHPDPQYATDVDPSPGEPLQLMVGAVHEHSGYSDGDPTAIPRDYFRAGRTGHNVADNGTDDTGVIIDFMFSSEHSDNEKLPVTTSAACIPFSEHFAENPEEVLQSDPTSLVELLDCSHIQDSHHYFKWLATLEQAMAESTYEEDPATGFTAVRGFEYTNDYFNHLNVYFSTNVVNVKVDGSMLSMDFFWNWLRKPVAEGGGADALVTFNHPGGDPSLSPFDGGMPHNQLLATIPGGGNWNDVAYIPDIDAAGRMAAMEVNGGDDIEWYVKALTKGWHIGAVANEDEHQREWSTSNDGKTLILTRGRSPRDYYYAFKNRRTVAIRHDLVNGAPGTKAQFPQVHYWANGADVQVGTPLGSIIRTPGAHLLTVDLNGLPSGYKAALVSNRLGGQTAPMQLGTVNVTGALTEIRSITAPATGEDWYFVVICPPSAGNCGSDQNYSAVTAPIWFGPGGGGGGDTANVGYGSGILGALAELMSDLNTVIARLVDGDVEGATAALQVAVTDLVDNLSGLPADAGSPGTLIGLGGEPQDVITRTLTANRAVEPVILTGSKLPTWSQLPATGAPYPYPSGAVTTGELFDQDPSGAAPPGQVRNAHNGVFLYPAEWKPGDAPVNAGGVPVEEIAAYAYRNNQWEEIRVQVDEKFPYFLANANSDFSVYSGTDEELSYAWDVESWGKTQGQCETAYDTNGTDDGRNEGVAGATPDPVRGLDDDDEIVFMASDAGDRAPVDAVPFAGADMQEIVLTDPLNPSSLSFVYLARKAGGSSFDADDGYVSYERDANADQWIDRTFFADNSPEKIGTSNTGYGPNLSGTVCHPTDGTKNSNDRFPRDGVTVTTDTYLWRATGRWMVREISVAKPNQPGMYGRDLVDRWKGRAFQQSPDSTISVVGFEDEQVNWEANSALLGERCGPVRCLREVWGADSGTNVTKTETFYRDVATYRYHVRVHPIPPDGLYTSWDYNRGAMVPDVGENVAAGRYYTVLRPQGVPIDGINDDVGQIDAFTAVNDQCPHPEDGVAPAANGRCPAFFDASDPTFNLTLAFNNWEQVSGKGDSGSLVYIFENKGPTSYGNPLVVPYYRDDACLDDGTGDDPVTRPWPGESYAWNNGAVPAAYNAAAGYALDHSGRTFGDCIKRQGAHAQHGVHYFVTHDTDNAFVEGKPITEIDGQQWQFMVPTAQPQNVGDPHANVVRVPLQAIAIPRPGTNGSRQGGLLGLLQDLLVDVANVLAEVTASDPAGAADALQLALGNFYGNLAGVVVSDPDASVVTTVEHVADNPVDVADTVGDLLVDVGRVIRGYFDPSVSNIRAGVGVVDMTPDVGYAAGQYADTTDIFDGLAGGEIDPYLTHKSKKTSHGVQSRLTARAIVVEGNNGKRIALVKSDNYLAQDNLMRRVGQILDANGTSGVKYEDILYHVTHNHSSAYASTLSWGVWVFEDVYDARFFENQARKIAQAIEIAAANMKPARMGATTVHHTLYKGNVVRPARADDGTPAGYPREYGDHGLVVMRFDDVSGATPKPLAVWVNWGEHPESLDGYDLHSADFLAPLERFVERELGAPLVFSQGDVGSAENTGNANQRLRDDGTVCEGPGATPGNCPAGEGVLRDWNHQGYVQTERNVRFLADAIAQGWDQIGADAPTVKVPFSTDFPVAIKTAWVPGPLSHPYPGVSNCRTETTMQGDVGIPVTGLPDCDRDSVPDSPAAAVTQQIYETMKAEGVPVPDHYDFTGFTAVEENLRLMLQTVRLGDVLLASCACEAQVDLILNLESRIDNIADNIYDGFDWACLLPDFAGQAEYTAACDVQENYFDPAEFPYDLNPDGGATNRDPSAIARMRAQVHNDARGWDAPENVLAANSEPVNTAQIWGNFTKEEIQDRGAPGYKLAVGVGHAGDYNGYTVSYREYMNRDSYRKALTSYGAHTADYMATRLVRMAAELQGGEKLAPEPLDVLAQADELRQVSVALVNGKVAATAYDSWLSLLPPDVGPAQALAQPSNITHFAASTFRWRGGGTQVDNPRVKVQQLDGAVWKDYADQTGEVQTRVHWPEGIPGVVTTYTGQFAWEWTANFEAYVAFPARLGFTPLGSYRFVVNGCINDDLAGSFQRRGGSLLGGIGPLSALVAADDCPGGSRPYELVSDAFEVAAGGTAARSYASVFPFIGDNGDSRICDTCSFRPWATH